MTDHQPRHFETCPKMEDDIDDIDYIDDIDDIDYIDDVDD